MKGIPNKDSLPTRSVVVRQNTRIYVGSSGSLASGEIISILESIGEVDRSIISDFVFDEQRDYQRVVCRHYKLIFISI